MNIHQRALWGTLARAEGTPRDSHWACSTGRKPPAKSDGPKEERVPPHTERVYTGQRGMGTPTSAWNVLEPQSHRKVGSGMKKRGNSIWHFQVRRDRPRVGAHKPFPEVQKPTASWAALRGVPSTQAVLPYVILHHGAKERLRYPEGAAPNLGGPWGAGDRCPRGQEQRSKWSVGSCSLWVKNKEVCPSGSLGLTVPRQ